MPAALTLVRLPPPAATWGNILSEGGTRLFIAPWIANLAGLSIIVLVWGVNMLANGLRQHYDPQSAERWTKIRSA